MENARRFWGYAGTWGSFFADLKQAAKSNDPIWIEGKPDLERWMGPPKEKVSVHFGYGPNNAGDFLKGNRKKIRQHHEKNGGVCISFDGGLWTSFGNRATDFNKHYFNI